MVTQEERIRILKLIERGDLTPEQAADLLTALDGNGTSAPVQPSIPVFPPAGAQAFPEPPPQAENVPPEAVQVLDPEPSPGQFRHWDGWWLIPMWTGVGITLLGALLLYLSVRGGGINFWFFMALLPFLLGVSLIGLAWASRAARWLHVRIRQHKEGRSQNINISLPLPLGLTSWGLNLAGRFSPQFREKHYPDVVNMVNQATHTDPIHIQVNEDNGDQVEVYIG